MKIYGYYCPTSVEYALPKKDEELELFPTIEDAKSELTFRTAQCYGHFMPVIGESRDREWDEASDTARLLVWIRKDYEPIPDASSPSDEEWVLGPRGGVVRNSGPM